jgi:hypothetical protein
VGDQWIMVKMEMEMERLDNAGCRKGEGAIVN